MSLGTMDTAVDMIINQIQGTVACGYDEIKVQWTADE